MRISDWSSDVCSSDLVGTADTFYLDGPAHRWQAVLDRLGAKSSFRFVPGRTHFALYAEGEDKMALLKAIATEMYAVARPGATARSTQQRPSLLRPMPAQHSLRLCGQPRPPRRPRLPPTTHPPAAKPGKQPVGRDPPTP